MKDWRRTLIPRGCSILDTMRAIDRAAIQLAIVVDEQQRLLGTVTDGDIRRGLIAGRALTDPVDHIMHRDPTTVAPDDIHPRVLALMRKRSLRQVPVVDKHGHVVGVKTLEALLDEQRRPNPVVLLAGGLGSRLRPLTEHCPKPLLSIGRKPILESIIESFIRCGFHRFHFSVNYKATLIEAYFGSGARWGVEIDYLREEQPLGTAGPLTLLPDVQQDVIVMNGDILTNLDFARLLDFHQQQHAHATMCVREVGIEMPYGVVRSKGNQLMGLAEKPVEQMTINAGVYVLSPQAVRAIPPHQRYDMTSLFQSLCDQGKPAAVYPITDYWLDVGRIDDFNKAVSDYDRVFPDESAASAAEVAAPPQADADGTDGAHDAVDANTDRSAA